LLAQTDQYGAGAGVRLRGDPCFPACADAFSDMPYFLKISTGDSGNAGRSKSEFQSFFAEASKHKISIGVRRTGALVSNGFVV
jgi:hypothetical protein